MVEFSVLSTAAAQVNSPQCTLNRFVYILTYYRVSGKFVYTYCTSTYVNKTQQRSPFFLNYMHMCSPRNAAHFNTRFGVPDTRRFSVARGTFAHTATSAALPVAGRWCTAPRCRVIGVIAGIKVIAATPLNTYFHVPQCDNATNFSKYFSGRSRLVTVAPSLERNIDRKRRHAPPLPLAELPSELPSERARILVDFLESLLTYETRLAWATQARGMHVL